MMMSRRGMMTKEMVELMRIEDSGNGFLTILAPIRTSGNVIMLC